MSSFVALDVETANSDYASICSIGAARFERGALVDEFYSLVDPQDYFAAVNVGAHGIDRDKVAQGPALRRGAPAPQRDSSPTASSCITRSSTAQRSRRRRCAPTCRRPAGAGSIPRWSRAEPGRIAPATATDSPRSAE